MDVRLLQSRPDLRAATAKSIRCKVQTAAHEWATITAASEKRAVPSEHCKKGRQDCKKKAKTNHQQQVDNCNVGTVWRHIFDGVTTMTTGCLRSICRHCRHWIPVQTDKGLLAARRRKADGLVGEGEWEKMEDFQWTRMVIENSNSNNKKSNLFSCLAQVSSSDFLLLLERNKR